MGTEDPGEIVAKLITTWESGDIDGFLDLFAEDAVYYAIRSMDPSTDKPAQGKPAIREVVTQLLSMGSDFHIEIHRQLVDGKVVMNERTDSATINGRKIAVPVCGVFEIEDGRIKLYRDYWDGTPFSADRS